MQSRTAQEQLPCMSVVVCGSTADKGAIGDDQFKEFTNPLQTATTPAAGRLFWYRESSSHLLSPHPGDVTCWTLSKDVSNFTSRRQTQVLLPPNHFPVDRRMALVSDANAQGSRSPYFPAADLMAKMPTHRTLGAKSFDLSTYLFCRTVVAEICIALLSITFITDVKVMDNDHGAGFPVSGWVRRRLLAAVADFTQHLNQDRQPFTQADVDSLQWLASDTLKAEAFHVESNRRSFDRLCELLSFRTDGHSPFRPWSSSYPGHHTVGKVDPGISNAQTDPGQLTLKDHCNEVLVFGPSSSLANSRVMGQRNFGMKSRSGRVSANDSDYELAQLLRQQTNQPLGHQSSTFAQPPPAQQAQPAPHSLHQQQTAYASLQSTAAEFHTTLYSPGFAPPPFRPYGRTMPPTWGDDTRRQACCRDMQFRLLLAIDPAASTNRLND